MPSDLKRINLCVPASVYDSVVAFRERFGIQRDATACLALIIQRLSQLESVDSKQEENG